MTRKRHPNIKPVYRTATYRLPPELDEEIGRLASKAGIPINTMAVKLLSEGAKKYAPRLGS